MRSRNIKNKLLLAFLLLVFGSALVCCSKKTEEVAAAELLEEELSSEAKKKEENTLSNKEIDSNKVKSDSKTKSKNTTKETNADEIVTKAETQEEVVESVEVLTDEGNLIAVSDVSDLESENDTMDSGAKTSSSGSSSMSQNTKKEETVVSGDGSGNENTNANTTQKLDAQSVEKLSDNQLGTTKIDTENITSDAALAIVERCEKNPAVQEQIMATNGVSAYNKIVGKAVEAKRDEIAVSASKAAKEGIGAN